MKSSTLRVADMITSLRGLPFYRMHEYILIADKINYDQTVGSIDQVGAGDNLMKDCGPIVFHLYVLCGIRC